MVLGPAILESSLGSVPKSQYTSDKASRRATRFVV